MRRRLAAPLVAAPLVAALLAGAAGCGERPSSADAARADSSAAGYAVGPRIETTTVARSPSVVQARADSSVQSATTTAVVAATTPGLRKPATNPATTPATTPARDSARTATRTPVPNVSPRPVAADSAPLPEGPVRVNEFLTYDRRSRTVSLQLIAGYNGLNGSLNYNGATHGSHGLYVPTGWRIHVAVTNRDSDLQHSAIVVQRVLPPPIEPTEPAFPAAALPQLDEGLPEDETGTLDFIADRAGQYMIACGVPGHAQAGMWLQLSVANGLKVPEYR